MPTASELQAENQKLRTEVDSYRQREQAELRSALVAAREEATLWKAEAKRIENAGRQLDAALSRELSTMQTELTAAQAELHALRQISFGRKVSESRN